MPTGQQDLEIDPETPGLFERPDYYELLARLRREAPVHPYAPGSWVLTRYEDVRSVSRDPERFRSGGGVLMNDPLRRGGEIPGSVLHMDPPQHASWRKVASRWFTPRTVAGLEDTVRSVVTAVLAEVPRGEEVDVVDAVAAPVPVAVIADLLGIADGDRDDFRRWSDACIDGADDDVSGASDVAELYAFLGEHVARRRAASGDDLLAALTQAEVEGRPIEDHEVVMYCLSLLVAGNETTRHLISGSVVGLAEHPDQMTALRGGTREELSGAVEECLRWVTPIQSFGRTATTEVTLGGCTIAGGDWVVLLYASANRDEDVFGPDADRFDLARPANPAHLAFGFGEHLCLGAALARLEARVFLEETVGTFASCALVGAPVRTHSSLVRGHVHLPVALA